jgi:anti-sigma B factor antagonist
MTDLRISVTVRPAGHGAYSVMSLAGEADVSTTGLRDALTAQVAQGKPRLLLVDLTAVQMIVGAYQVFRHEGGVLALVRPAAAVARTLGLTGVSQLIAVYDSMDEALASACREIGTMPGGDPKS